MLGKCSMFYETTQGYALKLHASCALKLRLRAIHVPCTRTCMFKYIALRVHLFRSETDVREAWIVSFCDAFTCRQSMSSAE